MACLRNSAAALRTKATVRIGLAERWRRLRAVGHLVDAIHL